MAVIKSIQNTSYVTKDATAPIYVSFYLHRDKIVLPCNISVKVESWDKESGKVLTSEKNHRDYSLCIEKVRSRVNDIMVRYRLLKRDLTKDLFLQEYNRPDDFKTFYDYVFNYMKRHKGELEESTLDVHVDVISKMMRYCETLTIDELTEEWLLQYRIFLKKKLENKESTINKNLAVIKKYCRAAQKEGYMLHNPFENIRIKSRSASSFSFLTEDELAEMVELYKNRSLPENYQRVLEFFLFMCFSSLHVTDAKQIKIENLGENSFTYYRIKNRNSKPDPIIIPISIPLRQIINSAAGGRRTGLLFDDMIADQKINEYIKIIARRIGIRKSLSCKAGRHTFATLFLQKTKDLATLKEILGHSDYRETLIYAHVLEESKMDGVKFFNKFAV